MTEHDSIYPPNIAELTGNLWDLYNAGCWIAIPTNPIINLRGKAVMGRGLALQVADLWHEFPVIFADMLQKHGNVVMVFPVYRLVTFPVKHHWAQAADLTLIQESVKRLYQLMYRSTSCPFSTLFMPRVGCGNGRRTWAEVRPLLRYLAPKAVVVNYQ